MKNLLHHIVWVISQTNAVHGPGHFQRECLWFIAIAVMAYVLTCGIALVGLALT